MMLRVKLFAVAKERAGRESVEVEIAEGATVRDLRAALAAQHPPLAEILPRVRLAVNNEYARDELVLPAGAEVAVIPPVSGG
jgi:molybdopterin converting factor subunit 1